MEEKKKVSISELQSAKVRLEQSISDLANAFAQKYGIDPCHLEICTNRITPIMGWASIHESTDIKVDVTIKL